MPSLLERFFESFQQPMLALLHNVEHKVDNVLHKLEEMEGKIMAALDDLKAAITQLQADVTAEDSVVDSAVTLLTNLTQLLKDAIASSAIPQEQIDAVKAVNAQIEAKTQAFAEAVAANTPAAPTP